MFCFKDHKKLLRQTKRGFLRKYLSAQQKLQTNQEYEMLSNSY